MAKTHSSRSRFHPRVLIDDRLSETSWSAIVQPARKLRAALRYAKVSAEVVLSAGSDPRPRPHLCGTFKHAARRDCGISQLGLNRLNRDSFFRKKAHLDKPGLDTVKRFCCPPAERRMLSSADGYLPQNGRSPEPGVEKMLDHPVGHIIMRESIVEGCSKQFADGMPARHDGRRIEGSRTVWFMERDDPTPPQEPGARTKEVRRISLMYQDISADDAVK
jgi:hypothetical protein